MKKGLFIVFCLTAFSLGAQNQIHPVIRVERLYDADLIEVSKPALDTDIPDSLRTFHTLFEYSIFDKPLLNLYDFSPLPPALVRPSTVTGKRYGYINLGTGYPWTPKADLLFQVPLTSGWHAGLQGQHRSLHTEDTRTTTRGVFSLEHRGKKNTFRLYVPGTYLYNTFALQADLHFFPPLQYQAFYKVGGGIETYALNNKQGTWHYYWKSEYMHAKNRSEGPPGILPIIRENSLEVEALTGYNLSYTFQINLGATAHFASNRWTPDSASVSRAVAHLFPHVILSNARYKVAAGIKVGYLLTPNNNKLGFFPWFDTHLVIAEDWLTLFAKTDGYQQLNTYSQRMEENPWITANRLYDAYIPWDVKAGFTGSLTDRFHYQIYGAYRYTKNQFYYATQPYSPGFHSLYTIHYADETRYSAGASFFFIPVRSWQKFPGNGINIP